MTKTTMTKDTRKILLKRLKKKVKCQLKEQRKKAKRAKVLNMSKNSSKVLQERLQRKHAKLAKALKYPQLMCQDTSKVLQKRLKKVTRQLKKQRKKAKWAKAFKYQELMCQELDSMSAEKLFELIGKPARKEGVRFIGYGVDEDRVEDTCHDKQVTSEWFFQHCANCGEYRNIWKNSYVAEKKNLVLLSCTWCRNYTLK